jgi:CRISPR/Cas system CSM-associated protein Csm3 (group 7 of RAMP superfamily)
MGNKHTHRYIARFQVEAETPLFVGSGDSSLMIDALVQKDVNGLPMIPGTALAGVLRHAFGENADALFGASHSDKNGEASKLKVSSAYMLLDDNKVSEGITPIREEIKNAFEYLPKRQHVRISHKGASENHGLFDNEVVYKGTRFVFELEVRGTANEQEDWNKVLDLVQSPTFRIGSGTRNGYGKLKVAKVWKAVFDLTNVADFEAYLNFNPSLNAVLPWNEPEKKNANEHFTTYTLELEPDSFFLFNAGFGGDEVDNKPLEEEIVTYDNGKLTTKKGFTVIPASSIKGALSHRLAFHYNKLKKAYAGNIGEYAPKVGVENEAVRTLFGEAGEKSQKSKAGLVFMDDLYFSQKEILNNKIFNHVAIDRFTGGAMHGALFSEKVSNLVTDDRKIVLTILIKQSDATTKEIEEAWNATLTDVCRGLLPLGGMTTKGHGIFTGSWKKDGEEKFTYQTQNA